MSEPGRPMHFLEHLEELRWVVVHSAMAVAVGASVGWLLSARLLEYIIAHTVKHVLILGVMEAFNERVRLAIVLGILIALPLVLFKIWDFVVPGLMGRERRMVIPVLAASLGLFALGGLFAFFMVIPAILGVLTTFLTPSMSQSLRLNDVLGFVYNLCLACGILFQLPLITLLLSWIGLVRPETLLSKWRHAIVGVLVLTAVITPGDVATAQIFLGIPIVLLYFISVAVAFMVRRKPVEGTHADA